MSDRRLLAALQPVGQRARDPYLSALKPLSGYGRTPSLVGSRGPQVMTLLRRLGALSPALVALTLIADVTGADEGEIARAATVWESIGQRLDDGAKAHVANLRTITDLWQALDKYEFLRKTAVLSQDTGVLRADLNGLGHVLDEIAAAFRAFWLSQWSAAVATMANLLRIFVLKYVPSLQTRLVAMALEKFLGAVATTASVAFAGGVVYLLVMAHDVMNSLLKKALQFGFIFPTGNAAIDFNRAHLDQDRFPTFSEPPAQGRVPDGLEDFDWVAPNMQSTAPGAQAGTQTGTSGTGTGTSGTGTATPDAPSTPQGTGTTTPTTQPPSQVTVGRNGTLSDIAQQVYGDSGRYRDIYEANRDLIGDDPNAIVPGQQLRIPEPNN
ncbi:hypothetical protein GCM10022224_101300 [Nonomuraea antimicrobica]|uniref:LysM domain-containing protein n=1 Tax=Nonomuraea antimicrobica TaxID=561173 RepID=A0ABP7EHE4_9ACTN